MVKVVRRAPIQESEKAKQSKQVLQKLHAISEESQAAGLAQIHGLSYVDLNIFPIDTLDLSVVREEDARLHQLAVFQKKGREFRVAILDPENTETLQYIKSIEDKNGWKAKVYVSSKTSIERAWNLYKKSLFLEQLDAFRISLDKESLEKFNKDFGDLLNLKNRVTEIPTTEVIQIILAGALKLGGSDIHLEPQESDIRLRYRIDGILQDIGFLPTSVYTFILSRVKMLGKMKLNIRDRAQDGHFSIHIDEKRIDIRINIIPGNHGESINMRLLDQSSVLLKEEDLGLQGLAYEQVQKFISKPNGMILNTGPTGSGKTTTLYTLLNKLNAPGVKIITIEDPVEYEIKGIVQTQVSKNKDYTFASGLRSIVRQDPDIVLVGEIRDDETADIAVNAALTGHLVFSTLHTNNAAGAIPRMIEMGVKPSILAPAASVFIAQRLVRKLCPHCKASYEPAEETINSLKEILSLISPLAQISIPKSIQTLYKANGCEKCHFTGYKGRIGIFEVLAVSQTIQDLMMSLASEMEIMKAALEEGMITMTQDGILKATEGITSLEEVWRVTGETDFLKEIYNKLMEQTLSRSFLITQDALSKVKERITSFNELETFLKQANQKEALRYIFGAALLLKANDVHIEPAETEVHIRLRIDGILQTIAKIPSNEYPSLLGEIKLLSGLKTEVRAGVKDSRFSILTENEAGDKDESSKVDIRVSIILGGYGETVVMRLLNQGAVALDIEQLGIRKENLEKLMQGIHRSNGVILNTGPTGSGKSTTLYSLLKTINTPDVKIITVEDPIEYQMDGILQTQVNEEDGYTFATALRSLMRQNPDVLMIGEIRDDETAQIAIQSSLTGHLVLSTLHTNNAAGAIPRLVNMNVRSDDLINAGGIFMAQRLIRRLCQCKEKLPLNDGEKEMAQKILSTLSPKSGVTIPSIEYHYHPKGCSKCSNTGYKGRVTISEVLTLDKDIQLLIAQNALAIQIQEKAIENGMITMAQDGMLQVLEGNTSLGEILRVTSEG